VEELWKVCCFDGAEPKWTKEVRLSTQEMCMLLRLLLCRKLEHHEIIDSVLGNRDLLEVRADEKGGLSTPQSTLLHYSAQKI